MRCCAPKSENIDSKYKGLIATLGPFETRLTVLYEFSSAEIYDLRNLLNLNLGCRISNVRMPGASCRRRRLCGRGTDVGAVIQSGADLIRYLGISQQTPRISAEVPAGKAGIRN